MRMIVTATETIQGAIIERYIDTICANIVLGSNFLSDFGASFTDFFGGRSNIYEGKLALIYDKAKKVLIQKAQVIGANAIVGFKVDFDEISSQGKSMFMVAASGTACFVKYAEKDIKTGIVSGIKLREMEIVHIISLSDDFDLYNKLLEDEDVQLRLQTVRENVLKNTFYYEKCTKNFSFFGKHSRKNC